MYSIDPNGPWKLYTTHLPAGSTAHGTITRAEGDTGALVQCRTGIYAQVNAGVIRTLNQRAVYKALRPPNSGRDTEHRRCYMGTTQFFAHLLATARANLASVQGSERTPDTYRAVAREALQEAHSGLSQPAFFAAMDALGGQEAAIRQVAMVLGEEATVQEEADWREAHGLPRDPVVTVLRLPRSDDELARLFAPDQCEDQEPPHDEFSVPVPGDPDYE